MEPEAVKDGPDEPVLDSNNNTASNNTAYDNTASSNATSNGTASSGSTEGTVDQILSRTIQHIRQKGIKMDPVGPAVKKKDPFKKIRKFKFPYFGNIFANLYFSFRGKGTLAQDFCSLLKMIPVILINFGENIFFICTI